MAKKMTKWEYCEIYERLTNFSYPNEQGKMVGTNFFSAMKLTEVGVLGGGEEICKSELWIPDATAMKHVPKDERGVPQVYNFSAKVVLRHLIAKLGSDGWELIYLNEGSNLDEPKGLFKRRIE